MILRRDDEPIPGYRLIKFLGKGAFGEVWKARSPGETYVALKFLDLSGKQGRKEFRAIQRVKEIRHAHLMPITAVWPLDDEGRVLADEAIEAIAGESPQIAATLAVSAAKLDPPKPRLLVVAQVLGDKTLADRLEECIAAGQVGIPADELLRYLEEAAKGIDFLNSSHDLGSGIIAIQHCDIKPANILLVGGSALICDFGVAYALAPDDATRASGMLGSPAYMAPECISQAPSSNSDQYALAISYVELRTGRLPFSKTTFAAVMDAHRTGKLDLSKLSPAEKKVIQKATAINPKKRYRSATEMVRALRQAMSTQDRRMALGQITVGLFAIFSMSPRSAPTTAGDESVLPQRSSVTKSVQRLAPPIVANQEPVPSDVRIVCGHRVSRVGIVDDRFLLMSAGQTTQIRDLKGDTATEVYAGHRNSPDTVCFIPTRTGAITVDALGAVRWVQVAPSDEAVLATLPGHTVFAGTPDGDWLLAGDSHGGAILRELSTSKERKFPAAEDADTPVASLGFCPDQSLAVLAYADGTVVLLDLAPRVKQRLQRLGQYPGSVDCLAVTPDGGAVVCAGQCRDGLSHPLLIFEFGAATVTKTFVAAPFLHPVHKVAFDPSGRWLVAASLDGTIAIWDWIGGRENATLQVVGGGSGHPVRTFAFTPTGGDLITGADDGAVHIRALASPARAHIRLEPHDGRVLGLAASESWLVASGQDGVVRAWRRDRFREWQDAKISSVPLQRTVNSTSL